MFCSRRNGRGDADSSTAAQPLLPGSIICFGVKGIYRVNLETGSCQKVKSGNWGCIRSAIRDPEQDGVFAFGSMGLYKVCKDGNHTKLQSGNWNSASDKAPRTQTACYLGDGRAIYIGARHMYSLNLRDGTYEHLGHSGHWVGCNCAVYATDGFAYAFGSGGVYKIEVNGGTYEKLCGGFWSAVDCAAQISPDIILCFGGSGIYHLNIKNGSNTKIASGAWGGMHCIIVDSQNNVVFAFGNRGIYKVSAMDGSYDKVLGGIWGAVHGATYDPVPIELGSFQSES